MPKSWSWEMTELGHLILKSVHNSCSVGGLLHPIIGVSVHSFVSLTGAPPPCSQDEGETDLHDSLFL